MTVRIEDYSYHFDEEKLIHWMYLRDYNDVVIESRTVPNHFYNICIDGYDDDYKNYYIEYVEHVPNPSKYDLDMAMDYKEILRLYDHDENVKHMLEKYEDDSWIMDKVKVKGE